MVDGSVSPEDINRLFRTGVVTYLMPSGRNYMRTIGKQKIEASTEDRKDNENNENEVCTLEYVHNFGERIPIKHGANMDSGCSTPLGDIVCKNRCWFDVLGYCQCFMYYDIQFLLFISVNLILVKSQ